MVGRPTVMTPDVVAKLEEGFLCGLNDTEACLYANIDKSTLYRYIQDNPNYATRKEELKNQPKIMAKFNILKELKQGDKETSKWYLERKAKEEFSIKQEIETTNTNINASYKELSIEELKKLAGN